jgi:glutamate-ammonia-ligase adenylyltransferase
LNPLDSLGNETGFWPGSLSGQQICSGFEAILQRGYKLPQELETWIVTSPFPQQAIADLENLLEIFPNCLDGDEVVVKQSLAVLGYSHFLTRRLHRYPNWIEELRKANNLDTVRLNSELSDTLREKIASQEMWNSKDFKNLLRRFKYQEYYRLTIRDLLGLATAEIILAELSSLTQISLVWAFRAATFEAQQLGLFSELLLSEETISPFLILGMGKLGGHEINYSSDVDLIFVHDENPLTGDEAKDQKLRQKIARTFIEWCTEHTEEGFLARVDMRLRPGGDSSALVLPLQQVEAYYWSKAALWEQQALIKASYVAGDKEIGEIFFRSINPYIYRKSVDENLLQGVIEIKERIEKEHLRESQLNVKLGVGGIREIEFFVQIFQLLYGGIRSELRTQNTLVALVALTESGILSPGDGNTLRECYLILRKYEHRLQMIDEQQIHTLPSTQFEQQCFARMMGFCSASAEDDRQSMLNHLRNTMARVRGIFGGLFDQKHLEVEAALRNSTRLRNFRKEEVQLLESLARQLSPILRQSGQDLLEKRFYRLFEMVGAQFEKYRALSNHPALWSRLASIAATSDTLWNHLLTNIDLLDKLEPTELRIDAVQLKSEVDLVISECVHQEAELDAIRRFKHTQTFLLGSAELDGLLDYNQARRGLTILAEIVLQKAYEVCFRDLTQRHGFPREETGQPAKFSTVGMGKLGGRELTYHSDLDLIFLYSGIGETDGVVKISNQQFFAKLIQRIISFLSSVTNCGYAYKLDTRLRPSGNAGVLVTTINSFKAYHQQSQSWEHQALIKSRVVGGTVDKKWRESVNQLLQNSAYDWTIPSDLSLQIAHLRERKELELSRETFQQKNLKEGKGGLLDIEFLTQYLQLKFVGRFPKLRTTETLAALAIIEKEGLIPSQGVVFLQDAYCWIRQIESALRLLFDQSVNTFDLTKHQTGHLEALLRKQSHFDEDLVSTLEKITEEVRLIYEKVMTVESKH